MLCIYQYKRIWQKGLTLDKHILMLTLRCSETLPCETPAIPQLFIRCMNNSHADLRCKVVLNIYAIHNACLTMFTCNMRDCLWSCVVESCEVLCGAAVAYCITWYMLFCAAHICCPNVWYQSSYMAWCSRKLSVL